jgi:hypothetical protein
MARMAGKMIDTALVAFETGDLSLVEDFEARDDAVDALGYSIFRECVTYMLEDPSTITRARELRDGRPLPRAVGRPRLHDRRGRGLHADRRAGRDQVISGCLSDCDDIQTTVPHRNRKVWIGR